MKKKNVVKKCFIIFFNELQKVDDNAVMIRLSDFGGRLSFGPDYV